MAAHQAPSSLVFFRQEHWLLFPSPMHESEKWKWSHSVVSDSSWHHGLQPTRLLHPCDFPGKSTGVGCHCLLWFLLWWDPKTTETYFGWIHNRVILFQINLFLDAFVKKYLSTYSMSDIVSPNINAKKLQNTISRVTIVTKLFISAFVIISI